MAYWSYVLIASVVFLAVGSAAPSKEKTGVTRDGEQSSKVPEECEGQTICPDKSDGYEKLESKMTINNPLSTLNKQGVVDGTTTSLEGVLSPQSDWHNCPYITKTERIYTYIHENETELVVQTPFMHQYVTTVRCAHEHISAEQRGVEECFQNVGVRAMGMRSLCKTTFGSHSITVYDANTQKIIVRSIQIPVCCSCVLTYD